MHLFHIKLKKISVEEKKRGKSKQFVIKGRVLDSYDGTPLPFVQVKVVVVNKQYEIPFVVNTNETGDFSLLYVPQGKMFGMHRVSVIHPDSYSRPEQVSFDVKKTVKPTLRATNVADLQFKRSIVKTGVNFSGQVDEKITIENKNSAVAELIKVTLKSKDNLGWGTIITQDEWGRSNENLEVHLQFMPPKTFKTEGEYEFDLTLEYGEENNKQTRVLPILVTVTNNVTGQATFKVDDIYTNFKGEGGNNGVENARIKLSSDKLASFNKVLSTDSNGKAVFKDLPIGFYNYQISTDKHTLKFGEIYVRAGSDSKKGAVVD